ncbi:nuclear protein [Ephemerocybe angulata]|uniref:uS12 prolyl 3,4-dihydroxylase n=1 Tax=Ephemerocybe angulata TaxID=980116 RepID=A0A8H6MEB0_9AGAR|nr:nuclear protein [Tulosesus angulatus]
MARTKERSRSPDPADAPTIVKRLKTSHVSSSAPAPINTATLSGKKTKKTTTTTNGNGMHSPPTTPVEIAPSPAAGRFNNGLFESDNINRLHKSYITNEPYKYAVVEKLFQDELLKNVKDECLRELSFTEKETDIYKVNQTGDLASLNYLAPDQLARLPNLLALRDALYSKSFRDFLQSVTGCGPLSGTKQDMSVNTYTRGCHLLNHDDVIGSRRVSYILYMPLPHYQLWQKDWGGALELYPTKIGEDGQPEPMNVPSKSIPPSWNQFIFFEVQPGKSFHSVEEVVVGGDGRERLSISGWFHHIQEGEEGYEPEKPAEAKSSREQLTSTSTNFTGYPDSSEATIPSRLTESQTAFLSEFLNPVYLKPRTMKALAQRFVEESSLELHSFLTAEIAESLETRLRALDDRDGLGADRAGKIPPHSSGVDLSSDVGKGGSGSSSSGWAIRGPPHKWRYCTLKQRGEGSVIEAVAPRAANPSVDANMRSLQDELFSSAPFRAWLSLVTKLIPMRHRVEARRFRPGLDYTLATSEEEEARLDVVLGLTPRVLGEAESEGEEGGEGYYRRQRVQRGWQSAEWGGWECYMAPHNEEDDPAVYRSSVHKKEKAAAEAREKARGPPSPTPSSSSSGKKKQVGGSEHSDAEMGSEGEEEEEDSTLLTVQPGFNRLLLVLRDERVMRFVKYVSAAAEGSRWDVCGEYEVGMMMEESGEEGGGSSGMSSS